MKTLPCLALPSRALPSLAQPRRALPCLALTCIALLFLFPLSVNRFSRRISSLDLRQPWAQLEAADLLSIQPETRTKKHKCGSWKSGLESCAGLMSSARIAGKEAAI